MTEIEYLNRIMVYLKQELPPVYRDRIVINEGVLIVKLPEDVSFNDTFNVLHPLILSNVQRVRNREYDLNFSVCSPNQLRDFKIYK
ncbi:hypothetical protein GCM10023149_29080 [Mucilaginibacter gynuensis]|uniref:Uncharacterized protein n=1 Tax=Mucilaginibacter gynuensis TaxID=1302236 RepID=A0ABP8GL35_9SPHI